MRKYVNSCLTTRTTQDYAMPRCIQSFGNSVEINRESLSSGNNIMIADYRQSLQVFMKFSRQPCHGEVAAIATQSSSDSFAAPASTASGFGAPSFSLGCSPGVCNCMEIKNKCIEGYSTELSKFSKLYIGTMDFFLNFLHIIRHCTYKHDIKRFA